MRERSAGDQSLAWGNELLILRALATAPATLRELALTLSTIRQVDVSHPLVGIACQRMADKGWVDGDKRVTIGTRPYQLWTIQARGRRVLDETMAVLVRAGLGTTL